MLLAAIKQSKSRPIALLRRVQSFIALIAIIVVAIALNGQTFLQADNLTDVLREMSIVGIMALAMTLVILTAGIDLSVGSILALSTCVLSQVLIKWQPLNSQNGLIVLAIVAALIASTLVGAFNGFLIAALRVPPFIITLATMIGIRGLAKRISSNSTVVIGFGHSDAPTRFADFFSGKPMIIGSLLVLAAIFWILLSRTVFGRYVRAIGDNPKAALYSGLPIASVIIAVYALSGLLCGVAGVLYAAQNHQSDPNAAMGYELNVIAAVVIGGTSLAGGRGTIAGTIIGTLIMGVLTNLLGLNNVDDNVQMMIRAAIIILAVWSQKRKSE